MSGMQCQAICKANGKQCIYPATYVFGLEYTCGVHAGKRRDEKYLIKNKSREEEPTSDSNTIVLSGLLRNLTKYTFAYRNIQWKSAEHAFQAMKFYYESKTPTQNDALFDQVIKIANEPQPAFAKRLGKETIVPIRPDWDECTDTGFPTKERFMFEILLEKFSPNSEPSHLLLATGDKRLEERSRTSSYWSIGADGMGKNRLGEILMMVRAHLRKRSFKENTA
jgi:ribA/ribD-fused uncharacterized protein